MSRKGRGLSDEDEALWRRVAHTARPLKRRVHQQQAEPLSRVAAGGTESAPRALAPKRATHPTVTTPAPADRGGEKRVRRGRIEIHARLDLHGLTQAQARAALLRFLLRAAGEGARCVIVVTGRGGRLKDGEAAPGILKSRLPAWLAEPDFRPLLSGFSQAHARHGGAGAYYVFLRRSD